LLRLERRAPVDGVAERVDDPADQLVADGHARDAAGPADGLALLDELPLAEERGADVVLLEVEREPGDAMVEVEHLHRDRVLEAVHARDAVADLEDGADLGELRLDAVVLDPLLEDRGDLFGSQFHLVSSLGSRDELLSKSVEAAADARVDPERACLEDDAADQVGVDLARGLDGAARGPGDLLDDVARLLVGELLRSRQLDGDLALLAGDQPFELALDLLDLGDAALLGQQLEEVADDVVDAPGDRLQRGRLGARVDLWVAQDRSQLRNLPDGRHEVAQLLARLLDVALLPGSVVERPRIDPVDNAHGRPTRSPARAR